MRTRIDVCRWSTATGAGRVVATEGDTSTGVAENDRAGDTLKCPSTLPPRPTHAAPHANEMDARLANRAVRRRFNTRDMSNFDTTRRPPEQIAAASCRTSIRYAKLAPMRVTIIGTSGQLASELRRRPWSSGIQPSHAEKVDVTNDHSLTALLDRQRPDLIMNASAYTAVDRAESDHERAFAVNESGPRALAEWCERNGAALIHVSTDYVFDGAKAGAYVEDDATGPLGVYGASKLAGEQAVRRILPRHVILRTSWVFSAHGQNFVKTILRLAGEREELRIVADQHGRPTSAADLADAMLRIAALIRRGERSWGTFHFASAGATTWHEFAQAILTEQALRTPRLPKLIPITTADYPTPAKRPANSVLDTTRFEQTFGFRPRPWREGLREALQELAEPVPSQ